ncbi:acyl-CoA N-acyltransferase [Circinella umbellata]|nr:acyl-CoA N-acyltransferase [Circinella umbellata]
MVTAVTIRPAIPDDVPLILEFIKDLALYEKAPEAVVATEELLHKNLFGERPYAEVIFAYVDDKPAGFALFFHNFSTWTGRPGLYLEDLFVKVDYRGLGIGKKLLVQLATIAKERECGRYEWVVIDWNTPSREFYEAMGAKPQKEWIIHRVEGKSLDDLAAM